MTNRSTQFRRIFCTCPDLVFFEGEWWCWRDAEYPGPKPPITDEEREVMRYFTDEAGEA